MKNKKLILIPVILLFLSFSCNKEGTKSKMTAMERVDSTKTLRIGVDDNFPPMVYKENNSYVGFDVDVIKLVSSKLGLNVSFVPIQFTNLIKNLTTGVCDCVWSGVPVKPEWEKYILFSKPYLENDQVVLVRKGEISKSVELIKKVIGVVTGYTGGDSFKSSSIGESTRVIIEYPDLDSAVLGLGTGQVDAVIINSTVVNSVINNVAVNLSVIKNYQVSKESYAIAFNKNEEELKNKIEKVLDELKESGDLAKISKKWFGTDYVIF